MRIQRFIVNSIRKVIFREKADSKSFVKYLRSKGITIGEDTYFFSPKTTMIDLTRPYLIKIGRNVQITHGVTILSHGLIGLFLKRCMVRC